MEENKLVKKAPQDEAQEEKKKKTILIVEDEDISYEILATMLKDDYEILRANNGDEGLRILRAQAKDISLVLLDILMPVMDGFAATELIRNMEDTRYSNIPIIAVTANAFSEDVKKTLDAGMNGHVSKPIDIKQLVNVLNEFLT